MGMKRAKELGFTPKLWNEGAKSSHHEDIGARPVLSSLLTDIREGVVKHLWVIENSRLSRNDMVASTIRYEMNKQGVILYTKDGQYDLNNPTDAFTRQILDATSQLENALRADRSRLGKLQKARQGFWHGGVPPYGYKLEKKKLVIDKLESKWVKEIFTLYANNKSQMKIKSILDENGISPRRGGMYWSIGSLNAIVKNTHYIGRYVFTDGKSQEKVEVKCPRILPMELWHKCNKKREHILERKGQVNKTKHFYLLRDFMYCGHCDTPMGAKYRPAKKENYYYCPAKERTWKTQTDVTDKHKEGRNCDMRRSLNIPTTNDVVWNTVKETVTKSNILKQRMKEELLKDKDKSDADYKTEIQTVKKKEKLAVKNLERVEQSIAKIETDKLLEKMDMKLYKQVRLNLNDERHNCQLELENRRQMLSDVSSKKRWIDWVGKFKDTYEKTDELSEEGKKEYIGGVIDKIKVHLDSKTNEHIVELMFQFPIVEDEYIDRIAKGGHKIMKVKQSFASKYRNALVGDVKKKQVNKGV